MILPKISIVTPTFNSGKYLEDTIKSVINQSYPNLEYIIIDGGSTDNTLDIISKYSHFISSWISEPDSGMYNALNKGFNKATGEIMAWINSDDLYHNGALRCVGEIFNDLIDVHWIIGRSSLFNSDGLCVKMNDSQNWSQTRIITGNYKWIQQENVFWRRSLWEKAGSRLNDSLRFAGDFDLWNRFFNYSPMYNVQTSFAGFRLHGQQLSILQSKSYEEEVIIILKGIKIKSLKVSLGKFLFSLVKRIGESKNWILIMFKLCIEIILKKIYVYPSSIYYNFSENKWKNGS